MKRSLLPDGGRHPKVTCMSKYLDPPPSNAGPEVPCGGSFRGALRKSLFATPAFEAAGVGETL
jgi:hypothetical protein